jgi:hypothetical protein
MWGGEFLKKISLVYMGLAWWWGTASGMLINGLNKACWRGKNDDVYEDAPSFDVDERSDGMRDL